MRQVEILYVLVVTSDSFGRQETQTDYHSPTAASNFLSKMSFTVHAELRKMNAPNNDLSKSLPNVR